MFFAAATAEELVAVAVAVENVLSDAGEVQRAARVPSGQGPRCCFAAAPNSDAATASRGERGNGQRDRGIFGIPREGNGAWEVRSSGR